MASVRRSFLFNIEWVEVLDGYPKEVRHEVLDGVLEYMRSGKIIEMKPLAKMAFSFIKRELDYNNERYESMVSKRSEAGRKGGLSKGKTAVATDEGSVSEDMPDEDSAEANASFAKQTKQSQANEASAFFAKQTEANEANAFFAKHNDNDNEYENKYENDIREGIEAKKTDAGASSLPTADTEEDVRKERVPYDRIRDLWNETCKGFNNVHTLSKSRKAKISVRVTEMGGVEKAMETIEKLFRKVSESKFLNGDNDRSWKASFDWLFENDKNWVKVMEGNYDNREPNGGHMERMNTNMTNFNNEETRYERF